MFLDLEKIVTVISHVLHIQAPLLLISYFSMASLSQLINQYWYTIIN